MLHLCKHLVFTLLCTIRLLQCTDTQKKPNQAICMTREQAAPCSWLLTVCGIPATLALPLWANHFAIRPCKPSVEVQVQSDELRSLLTTCSCGTGTAVACLIHATLAVLNDRKGR